MSYVKNKVINYTVRARIEEAMRLIANTTEVQLPDIEMGKDTIKGAGILGEIDWPSIFSPGSMAFSFKSRVETELSDYLIAPVLQEFEIRWTVDVLDTNNVKISIDSHKVVIKGLSKKLSTGKLENGSAQDTENEFEVLYYKKTINGVQTLEIDKLNYVFKVGGVDYGAEIREFLGGD